ncbi:MAG: FHA domain-containing protein [Bacteroidales bacterium]|nr:FHA domain-containing protein [Bacteroidales bacterium]
MIQCPNCRAMIPDDSAFCDQCGKELMWCPECKRPKRGTECPVCGNDLIPGRKWLAGDYKTPDQVGGDAPGPAPVMPGPDRASQPTKLSGAGLTLVLQPGPFGRRGGIWPELGSCQYVSGSHGVISKAGDAWAITDSGSTNGTFVNGARLSPGAAVTLKIGDKVKIATLEFTVQ